MRPNRLPIRLADSLAAQPTVRWLSWPHDVNAALHIARIDRSLAATDGSFLDDTSPSHASCTYLIALPRLGSARGVLSSHAAATLVLIGVHLGEGTHWTALLLLRVRAHEAV